MKIPTRHTLSVGVGMAAAAAVIAVGGTQVIEHTTRPTVAAVGPAVQGPGSTTAEGSTGYGDGSGTGSSGSWSDGGSGWDPSGQGLGSAADDGLGTQTSQGATTEATASQVAGVVDILTSVDYGSGEAAGTGMVLSSDGRILTNNHVIEGSTSITVTVLSTGRTYSARVVGTSPTNDIAVLQLADASGLTTARLGSSSGVKVGDAVTGVGNAGNETGTSAAAGTVTALDQPITASDGDGSNAEQLTGLIETSANIQAGDSGGPLYDAAGTVIGIDTAAESSGRSGVTLAGYAIPIDHAVSTADQIVAGVDTETIHQGLPAFLGVQTNASTYAAGPGVTIAGTVPGSAAAKAGLSGGDTIIAIGGVNVSSRSALTDAIATHRPGDRVSLTWTDGAGTSHRTTVTLGSGPAD